MKKTNEGQRQNESRKAWSRPRVRAVVPASRTRGGGGSPKGQDDAFYDVS